MSKPNKCISMCGGCRNDFYNGHNDIGVQQCWHFKTAAVEKRIKVGVWQNPPYSAKNAQWTLSCHMPEGFVQVKPDALDSQGFWKH